MKKIITFFLFMVTISLFATRLAIVIAPGDFQKKELIPVKKVFTKNNIAFDVFSTEKGIFLDMSGKYKENVKHTIEEIKVKNYAGIIIIGGTGTREFLWNNKLLQNKVREFNDKNKLIAAICFGPIVLINAGVLKGKAATCFRTFETVKIFKNNNVIYCNQGIIKSKNIITANGPQSANDFANSIIFYFKVKEKKK